MTVRHRYATWSKFVVSSVVALALVVGLGLPGTHADPVKVTFQVLDGPGVGFNDPLLGPQRLAANSKALSRCAPRMGSLNPLPGSSSGCISNWIGAALAGAGWKVTSATISRPETMATSLSV